VWNIFKSDEKYCWQKRQENSPIVELSKQVDNGCVAREK
jgi:hypothetical protein